MPNTFELTGTIAHVGNVQQVKETFRKREFAITFQDGNYPQAALFQLVQDKVNLVDGLNIGDPVRVLFNVRGREYTKDGRTSYFNSLDAWRVERLAGSSQVSTTADSFGDDGEAPF